MEENKGLDNATLILGYIFAAILAILFALTFYWIFKGGRAGDSVLDYNLSGTIKTPQLSMSTAPSKFV